MTLAVVLVASALKSADEPPVFDPQAELVLQIGHNKALLEGGSALGMVFSPDGKWLVTWVGSNRGILIRDAANPERIVASLPLSVKDAVFAEDGKTLLIDGGGFGAKDIKLAVPSFKAISTFDSIMNSLPFIRTATYLPDLQRAIFCEWGPMLDADASEHKGSVCIWNYQTKTVEVAFDCALDWPQDSWPEYQAVILPAINGVVIGRWTRAGAYPPAIYDLTTGNLKLECKGKPQDQPAAYNGYSRNIVAAPAGDYVAVKNQVHGMRMPPKCTVTIWETKSGEPVHERTWSGVGDDSVTGRIEMLEDGSLLIPLANGLVRWNYRENHEPRQVVKFDEDGEDYHVLAAAISSRVCVLHQGVVTAYDLNQGAAKPFIRLQTDFGDCNANAPTTSAGGRLLAGTANHYRSHSPRLAVWDLVNTELIGQTSIPLERDYLPVFMKFGQDKHLYVAAAETERLGLEDFVHTWRIERFKLDSGKREHLFAAGDPISVHSSEPYDDSAFDLNDRWAILNLGAKLRHFELSTGKELDPVLNPHPGSRFSREELYKDAKPLPGGKGLLIGTMQGLRLVDFQKQELDVALFRVYENNEWIITTPDGLFTASPGMEKVMRVYKDGVNVTSEAELAARRQPEKIKQRLRPYVLDSNEYAGKLTVPPPVIPVATPARSRDKPPGDF